MNVVVTGIGLLSCLGDLTESWQSLLAGKSGIKLHQPFPAFAPRPLGLIDQTPISLSSLTEQLVHTALKDANLTTPLAECGVVMGSSRGYQAVWEQWLTSIARHHPRQTSPPDYSSIRLESWLDHLPHHCAIATARLLGSTGPVLAPMAACATGIWAIAQGVELIQQGRCQRVIAGAVEAPITPLNLASFEQMGALATTGCYPFDHKREGLVLAEGGAVFVLESEANAAQRGALIYGRVLGFGLTCDAYHVSAPDRNFHSAAMAVKQCLERSCLLNSDIDYIHAHGTSTQLNDHREAQLIKHLFSHRVAVSSTKGATGHTLGASGAMGIAFSLMALRHQQLPPCVGLQESAFDLNLITQPQQQTICSVLCFGFGFGGQNAVIALA
ncbi:beta-ketoacyl-ACP synthase [Gloeothece verrucosa]|uniref:Beta-ketoacyl synthase n=1 Tax=Gloeothece verrucosa (strain PCC 7822) TaxID=497965 RepID=E0U7J3_GLOV7|nr:beta-ketoacyl-ACP synthase [Gloeothece verrucosa]ADN13689.1 Beta-ketoacyl synthase [Gloeothece verrucosa PCC 7822]